LTSLGLAVSTVLINGVLVGYTGETTPTAVTGEGSGNVVFFASVSDVANGTYDFTLVKPLDHAAGNGENSLSLTFNYTATDSDGDTSSNTFTVNVIDDILVLTGTSISVTVDEDDILNLRSQGTSPNDGTADGSSSEFAVLGGGFAATVSGSVAATVAFGADGQRAGGGFSFTSTAVSTLNGLGLTSNGGAVVFAIVDGAIVGYVNGAFGGFQPLIDRPVMSLELNGTTGAFTFRQYDQLDHQAGNGQNTTLANGLASINFGAVINATDGDGDVVNLSGKLLITVRDDVPEVSISTVGSVTIDETSGNQNDDTTSSSVRNLFNGVAVKGLDADMGGAIYARHDVVDTSVNGGADDVVTSSLMLRIDNEVSGLFTTEGQAITLSLEGGLVVGRIASGEAAFAVAIQPNGNVSVVQYMSLQHPNTGSTDESINLTGKISAVFTATDSDGDVVSKSVSIGDKVNFDDDGPVLTGTSVSVTVDEDDILNLRSQGTSPNDGTADGSSSEFAVLGGGFAATVSGSVAATVAFGADGQRAGGGFSFTSTAVSTLNGLGLTSNGGAVVFAIVDGAIVGYVNGAFGGFQPLIDRPVMSLELNGTTGAFTFRQYDQLDHQAGNGQNTTLANGLASINFGAVINATDGDGDVVNLSGKLLITVRDDVPEVSISTVGSVTIDETSGNQNDDTTSSSVRNLFNGVAVKGLDADMGGAIYARHDVVDTSVNGGADDVVTSSLMLRIDNEVSGLFTTEGQAITLSLEGGLVVGRIASGEAAFAVAIQPNGNVSVVQYMSLQHPNTGSTDESINLTGKISAVFTATDSDGDVVSKSVSIGDKVNFDDDGPRVSANTLVQIDEDTLAGGNPGGNLDDVDNVAATGTLAHDSGADGTASILWSAAGLTLPSGFWFSVSVDGTVMTITQLQGGVYVPVVTATITNTATGAYSVAQVAPIDHPQGTIPGTEDNVQFTVSYDVTDGDGDQVRGTLSINVDDDTPKVGQNTMIQLDDDALVGGNPGGVGDEAETAVLTGVLSHSGGADGTASVLWAPNGLTLPNGFWYDLSADSKMMTITQLQNGSYVGVFKVVITDPATGAYLVTQLAPVNHNTIGTEDNAEVSFQYRVTDGDGDVATGTLTVNIDDDTPTLTQTLRYNDVYEAGVGAATGTDSSTFAVNYGADGYGATAFTGALKLDIGGGLAGNVNLNLANGPDSSAKFTSEGRVIIFTMVDANTIRGVAGNELIIEIKLTDTDSSAKTTLYGNIDHIAAQNGAAIDRLVVDATVKFTDGDGDAVTGIIRSTIHDEAPVAIGPAQAGTLSEAGLPFVSSTFASLNIDIGADNKNTHVGIGLNSNGRFIDDGLTSDGVPLQYIVRTANGVDQELVAFKQGDTEANPVFIVAVLHPGSFAATLYQNVDHLGGNDTNLALHLTARVYDGDGDFVDQPFTINIADSVPILTQTLRYNDVYEAGVGAATGTDSSTFAVNYGADGYGATAFTGALKLDIGGGLAGNVNLNLANGPDSSAKFTSEGRVIIFTMVDANTIRGVAGNELIIEIKLTDTDSSAKTTLYGNIDHIAAQNGAAIDRLVVDATVKFTDGDGDAVTGIIRSTIHDEAPVAIGPAQAGTLSEAGLPFVSSTFASLNIDIGADNKNTHVGIGLNSNGRFIDDGLTSDGVPLQYIVRTANGVDQELVAFKQGDTEANPVFIVAVLHPGSFAATLYQNVDHLGGNDTNLALHLTARVYDGDGDFVDQPFTINIADSVPIVFGPASPSNLLANGNFTVGDWSHAESWGSWTTEDIGWKIEGTADDQAGVRLERIVSGYNNMTTSNGSPMVDLGATPGNVAISQTITGLVAGETYRVSFEVGSPNPGSSGLQVLWNGALVQTVAVTNAMTVINIDLPVLAGSVGTVTFKETGEPTDNTGTYLANIGLHEASAVAAPVVSASMSENDTMTVPFVEGTHFGFGADNLGHIDVGSASIAGPAGIALHAPEINYVPGSGFIITPSTAFDALGEGEIAKMTIPYTVTDGDGDKVLGSVVVTITGTNDIPVIDLSTATAGNETSTSAVEQTAQQFAWQADLSDVDSPNLTSMTLALGNIQDGSSETLSLNAAATAAAVGLTVTFNAGVLQITGPASVDRYETILKNTIYLNSSDNPHVATDRTVTVIVNDGIANSAPQVATIHLIALNDAPVLAGPLADTVAEGAILTLTSAKLGYTDPDNGPTEVVFRVSNVLHGVITNGGAPATSFTAAELNSGLIKFTHDGSEGPTASFNVAVEDGNQDGSVPTVGTFNLTVTPVNDAPVITGDRGLAVNEGATVAVTATDLGFSDPDDVGTGVTFTVTSPINGSVLVNAVAAASFTGQQLTDGLVSFRHNGSETTSASFGVSLEDGNEDSSAPVTTTINVVVTPVNDAPVLSDVGGKLAYTENDVARVIDNAITITDADDTNIEGATIKITGNFASDQDVLSFTNQNGITGSWNATTGTLTLSGSATKANYELALESIKYNNTSEDPSGLTRTVSYSVTDSDVFSNVGNVAIAVTVVNDAPVLTGLGNTTFNENVVNAGPQLIDNNISLTDADSANFAGGSLTASWSSGGASQDQLSFLTQGNSAGQISISGNNIAFGGIQIGTISGNGTNGTSLIVSFNALATPFAVDALIQRLAYANTSDTPNLARTLSITVADGDGGTSVAATSMVTVSPEADALGTMLGKDATVTGSVSASGTETTTDPSKSGYWSFYAVQGQVVSIGVTRLENAFDPALWLFAGKVSSTAVFGSAIGANDPGFLRFGDDEAAASGPWGDPRIAFTAATTGVYTLIVVNSASGNSGDGRFDYSLTINGNSAAPVGTDPIILDLDHNGFALSSIDHGVTFDINADGNGDHVAWTKDDAILAFDIDGNGKIDNGSEIFTPSFNGGNHAGGVAALATLDSNGDGKIDAQDAAYSKLSVWIDANNNGISDSGELSSLLDHHIASISLGVTVVDGQQDGQAVLAEGTFTLDNGSTGNFIEVGFDAILGDGTFGTAGDDILAAGLGHYSMTGGAGADTFVLDADAFKGIELADVITDYKAGEGDVLDVSNLLTSLLGHEASEADAMANVKTTVNGADTVVSVNDNGAWHDVAVLQDYTSTVKVLYDDDHNTTSASHSV
jgi:T1SS-143 domain-containing protein